MFTKVDEEDREKRVERVSSGEEQKVESSCLVNLYYLEKLAAASKAIQAHRSLTGITASHRFEKRNHELF